MSRVKGNKKVYGENILAILPEEKRFATPEIVSRYRAKRLACDTILDLCCGLGFQSFAFAKTCNHVIAVEKNPELVAKARTYAEKLGLKNITFLCGDVLSQEIVNQIKKKKLDIIFCDPQRAATEKERTLATIRPNIQELFTIYRTITPNIALELPPHISKTTFDAEYEYLSVDNALNRLTLYFGSLKQAGRSVVLLPQNKRITAVPSSPQFFSFSSLTTIPSPNYSFLLEPNPALVLSGLFYEAFCAESDTKKIQNSFVHNDIIQFVHGRKIYFLSTYHLSNPFFISYKILEKTDFNIKKEKEKIISLLQKLKAGRIIIRYHIDPKQYWQERRFYEKQLQGNKTIYVFLFDNILLCEKIK